MRVDLEKRNYRNDQITGEDRRLFQNKLLKNT